MNPAFSRLVAGLLVGAGVALAGYWVDSGLERLRMADRSVTFKGLAEQEGQSDFAVWTLSFRRAGNEFAGVQQALAPDRDRVLAFLMARGFTDAEVEARPLQVQARAPSGCVW